MKRDYFSCRSSGKFPGGTEHLKKIVRFLRMAEFSKRKFVFHSISSKQPFFKRFRPSQSFFGKWFGFVHIKNAIPGWNWLVLIFAYHLPKAWTDRFADVNNCQSPSRLSGWPSGLRRCVQVAVYSCRRGFESHSWQLTLFFSLDMIFSFVRGPRGPGSGCRKHLNGIRNYHFKHKQ